MGPIASILSAIRNIHRLGGRATRSEYWWVFLLLIGGVICATYVDVRLTGGEGEPGDLHAALSFIFILLYVPTLLLMLSVTIRRLHDLDMSAWYLCLYFIPFGLGFVFMGFVCSRKGTLGPNKYGPSPGYVDVFSEVEEFG